MSTTTTSPSPSSAPVRVTLVILAAPPLAPSEGIDLDSPRETIATGRSAWPEGEPTWEDAEWR